MKRFLRIYPVLLFGLLLGFVHTLYTTQDINIIDNSINFFNSIFLIYSIADILPPTGNPILATVIVEFCLYCIYILVFKMILEKKWFILFGLFLCIYFINHNINQLVQVQLNWYWQFHNVYAFAIYWFIGAYFVQNKTKLEKQDYFMIVFLLTSILYLCYKDLYTEIQLILQAVLIGYVIRVIVYYKLELSILAFVGKISFSLYVSHMVIIDLFQNYLNNNSYQLTPLIHLGFLIFCFVFALIIFNFIESPIHNYARNLKR